MKNKDKYDLTKLRVDISYLTDGCGKKVDNMRYVIIKDGDKKLFGELVNDRPMDAVLKWLESE